MNRRKFFALIAAIPFVGRMVAKPKPKLEDLGKPIMCEFVWPPTPTETTMYVHPSKLEESSRANPSIKVVAHEGVNPPDYWYVQTPYYHTDTWSSTPRVRVFKHNIEG